VTFTPEQKRAYAIRKRVEARREAARTRRSEPDTQSGLAPVGGYVIHPSNHACSPYDIEYGEGRHVCQLCGRRWTLGPRGYAVSPLTKRKPASSSQPD
jgi:hypothetical protein